jgi:serine/threonine protein kinase
MGCASAKNAPVAIPAPEQKALKVPNFHEQYVLQTLFGQGHFGRVFSAYDYQHSVTRAVKILDMQQGKQEVFRTPMRDFKREASVWKIVGDHRNCVQLLGIFMDADFGYLVMELCRSTLLHGLRKEPELNEIVLARYFKDMLTALHHLHSVNVVHRDVKQDNFMLGGGCDNVLKLCDFGLSAVKVSIDGLRECCGTAPFMSPEMLVEDCLYGSSVDNWSVGVIVYTLFFGGFPYVAGKGDTVGMKDAIRTGRIPPTFTSRVRPQTSGRQISSQAMAFVKGLLIRQPADRPTAAEARAHPYILQRDACKAVAKQDGSLVRVPSTQSCGSPPSLEPMLDAAVRCGAFGAPGRCVPKPDADHKLAELQRKSGAVDYMPKNLVPWVQLDEPDSKGSCSVESTTAGTEMSIRQPSNETVSTKSGATSAPLIVSETML